eukprot:TRINITY_DN11772_c1_g1_i1.p1 TRINITY_DN11772_c1_g1~~TRINITY_DN11772_c1_g1_i1.p1  ORF type:complete len:198 (+),score=36.43 TRINITY_DN11772_c1_g1_i1:124-717(+)
MAVSGRRHGASPLLAVCFGAALCSCPSFLAAPERQATAAAVASRRGALGAILLAASPARATNAQDQAWLDAKAKEPGVVTLPSGLMYKVLQEGPAGAPKIERNTKCNVKFTGSFTNGEKFDGATVTITPKNPGIIKGWQEALPLMNGGAKWELYIPSDLAYGDDGTGGAMPKGAAVVYQLQIVKVFESIGIQNFLSF